MKLSFTFVGALAVVAHGHGKDHSYLHKNGTSSYPTMSYPFSSSASPSQVGISSGLAPYPSPSISSPGQAGLSTGVPLSTGATPTIYTTTKIVSVLTTFCPATPSASALTITQNSKTYTLTVGETTTIYDCPCTSTYTTTGYNVSTPTQSGDTTLIYTIGTGSSTSVVTTTVRHTSYQTNTATVYATSGAVEGESGDTSPQTSRVTVQHTSTSTIYVSDPSSPSGGTGIGQIGANGSAGICAPQVTVTVTDEQTVTVTATASSESGPSPSSVPGQVPISSALPSLSVPYGLPNGTHTSSTGASSGFLTKPSASFTFKSSSSLQPALTTVTSAISVIPVPVVATAQMQGYDRKAR